MKEGMGSTEAKNKNLAIAHPQMIPSLLHPAFRET